jgi:hypothetical protein
MTLQLKKAQRSKAYLKLGISAASGGGKTLSSLFIGKGLMEQKYPDLSDEEQWEKICVIDTENGSGQLYANGTFAGIHVGGYNTITLEAPFEADKYTQAIDLCQKNGIEVCIIDSTTHLWSGEGGLLEQQSNAAKRSGNSYTAWREITPQHNRFVEKMLQIPMHIIATMRAKQEYVQEHDDTTGKTTIRKIGMEPEQRKGMEYEFTMFFDMDPDHVAHGAKDRTSLFDRKYFNITPETGKTIMKWLEGGTDASPQVIAESSKADPEKAKKELQNDIIDLCKTLGGQSNDVLMETLHKYHPSGNPNAVKDTEQLIALKSDLEMLKIKSELQTEK